MKQKFTLLSMVSLLVLGACQGGNGDDQAKAADVLAADTARSCTAPKDEAVFVKGGRFLFGQEEVYREEGPAVEVGVNDFWMDNHEVTNRQFAQFVEETGYITIAEKPVDPSLFAVPVEQIPADMLKAGSAVFIAPDRPSNNYNDWWKYIPGANWKKPYGPDGADYQPDEPVVHLGYDDMLAYAQWRGGRIPTEAEWEFAASTTKNGRTKEKYTEQPVEANSWQGVFPVKNFKSDGFETIAPVGCYQANDHGLYDMVGNVWEMTADYYAAGHDGIDKDNPKGPSENTAYDPNNPGFASRVIKGGSYLCAPNYCQRYRPAARSGRDPGLGASNVGFRLVYDKNPVKG